ncbi:unnamed protein product [Prunus armeniaca]
MTTTAAAAAPELDPNFSLKSHAIITILITCTLERIKLKIRRRRNSKSPVATSVKMSSTMRGSNFIPGSRSMVAGFSEISPEKIRWL